MNPENPLSERVTMAAVAKRAGVHVTTVSAALRNHPSLPLTTRHRLQALAKEMGYQRDPALASLVAYRSRNRQPANRLTIAYITNWDTRMGWKASPAHAEFFAGASAKAPELGYQLEHFWLRESGLTHRRMSEILTARGITGVIFASHLPDAGPVLDFQWANFSAVKIDFFPHHPALHTVTNDQRAIMQLAMQRTIDAGYRRIGCVMPRWWDDFVDRAWSAGFLAEQQTLAAEDRVPLLLSHNTQGDFVPADEFNVWYQRHRPDAIISYAPFVLPQLEAMSVSVPNDVAFIDIFLTQYEGRIAGVRQNCHRVGEVAVEVLVGQMQQHTFGTPAFATSTLVEGTWFEGASLPSRHPSAVEAKAG
jgi:LacI family transcriptional regulator